MVDLNALSLFFGGHNFLLAQQKKHHVWDHETGNSRVARSEMPHLKLCSSGSCPSSLRLLKQPSEMVHFGWDFSRGPPHAGAVNRVPGEIPEALNSCSIHFHHPFSENACRFFVYRSPGIPYINSQFEAKSIPRNPTKNGWNHPMVGNRNIMTHYFLNFCKVPCETTLFSVVGSPFEIDLPRLPCFIHPLFSSCRVPSLQQCSFCLVPLGFLLT